MRKRDIIKRLREGEPTDRQREREARIDLHALLEEAASEIERLRGLLDRDNLVPLFASLRERDLTVKEALADLGIK